jgi:LysR family transcriptional regulator, glycine cleavage system transcriptional activator
MTKLPPLAAIRAFEAVGRLGSVGGAALELGVSSGAITQQIHALEKHLKLCLVQRSGRGIELTAWGRLYLPRVMAGMDQLNKAGEDISRARMSNHLVISTFPSLAAKWLGPLMFDWKKTHQEATALVEGVHPEPNLDRGEADFRVSYGSRYRQHSRYTHLFTDRMLTVASPAYLARTGRIGHPRDLLKCPLLWVDWGPEYQTPPTWRDWFIAAGVDADHVRCDLVFSFPGAAVDAAIESRGVALSQYSIVASSLAVGTLVQVLPQELPLPEAHFLAWSGAALDKPVGAAFHAWLIREARRFERGP